jgi:hypothetical protein
MAQTAIKLEPKLDPNRILVFLADRDLAPPYHVTGALVEDLPALYINGIQVQPYPSRRKTVKAMPQSRSDLCRAEFHETRCEMQARGLSREEILGALADHIRGCEGVVSVERDEIMLVVVYDDSTRVEYIATTLNCDMQKTVDWMVKRLQRKLDNGYAHLFTSSGGLNARPDEYEILVSEIHAARDGTKSPESEWSFLKPEMVRRIRQGEGD